MKTMEFVRQDKCKLGSNFRLVLCFIPNRRSDNVRHILTSHPEGVMDLRGYQIFLFNGNDLSHAPPYSQDLDANTNAIDEKEIISSVPFLHFVVAESSPVQGPSQFP